MNETWWVNSADLDEKQLEILVAPRETEMLIVGPPGSGKTNILMLRANYVRSVAPRILLLTFTRTLAEFLRAGPNVGRADQIQVSEIKTFMGWAKELIRLNGGQPPADTGGFDACRHAAIERLNEVVELRQLGQLYDVIFIDEVQDFWTAELEIIRQLAVKINAAGDNRQRIYNHREGIPTTEGMVDQVVELENHYRIGEKICRFADQVLPPVRGAPALIDGCKYPEDMRESSVLPDRSMDNQSSYVACIQNIKDQLRYISDEPIGVICGTTAVRDEFWDALNADGDLCDISVKQSSAEYHAFGPETLIRVMTIASAKGSEFRAVHILNAEYLTTANRELAFTAVTRAKTELTLYHVAPLAGHMQPPATSLPPVSSIF